MAPARWATSATAWAPSKPVRLRAMTEKRLLRHRRASSVIVIASLAAASSVANTAAGADRPWMNAALDPDRRADLVLAEMSRAEKQTLVFGYFATDAPWKKYVAPK